MHRQGTAVLKPYSSEGGEAGSQGLECRTELLGTMAVPSATVGSHSTEDRWGTQGGGRTAAGLELGAGSRAGGWRAESPGARKGSQSSRRLATGYLYGCVRWGPGPPWLLGWGSGKMASQPISRPPHEPKGAPRPHPMNTHQKKKQVVITRGAEPSPGLTLPFDRRVN